MDLQRRNVIARTFAPTRRSTLSVLLAAIGGFARHPAGQAKVKKPDCRKSAVERCQSDTELCRAVLMGQCQGPPESCVPLVACCDTCSANGMFTCLLALE